MAKGKGGRPRTREAPWPVVSFEVSPEESAALRALKELKGWSWREMFDRAIQRRQREGRKLLDAAEEVR